MSRALQRVKEGAMQTTGRKAFQKGSRRNKGAKEKVLGGSRNLRRPVWLEQS